MTTDRKTLGPTPEGQRVLTQLLSAGHFSTEVEAARFAMAIAVSRGVPVGTAGGAGTKWNIGSVDTDGSLRGVIEALYPNCTEPYRLIQYLMDEGLKMLDAGASLPPDVTAVLFPPISKKDGRNG